MIYLGSDHAGFELKEFIKGVLEKEGHITKDLGAYSYAKDDDYPDYIFPVVKAVSQDTDSLGIIFGGSGQGEAITANSIQHVRAAVFYGGPLDIVRLSKEHNNANVLSLGARFISKRKAKAAVTLWLDTKFSNEERHVRRLKKEDEIV